MKRASILVTSAVIMLAVAALATAATAPAPTTQPAVFAIQAKVLQVGPGWVQVQVVKVQRGSGLRANAKLRIIETAKTKVMRTGKVSSVKDLKAGEMVQIRGSIARSGKTLTYQAGSVTIIR